LDTEFVAAHKPVENEINLTNEGNGDYSGKFSDTEESGVYKLIFKFSGEDETTGVRLREKNFPPRRKLDNVGLTTNYFRNDQKQITLKPFTGHMANKRS